MKKFAFVFSYTAMVSFLVYLVLLTLVVGITGELAISPKSLSYWYGFAPVHNKEIAFESNVVSEGLVFGSQSHQDNFPIINVMSDVTNFDEVEDFEFTYGKQDLSKIELESDMIYKNSFTEQPLFWPDYYYRKYENAVAGANGLNKMPILLPGKSIGVIKDRYIDVKIHNGYVQPPGYYFASGLCWSTSALGAMMDQANTEFKAKYGVPLFTFRPGDRAPHTDWYRTYLNSNNGRGYTVLQMSSGVPVQDYRFTVNPELKNVPELADIKIKIVMLYSREHETAAAGQSIGGYIISNKEW
jgi:hypothetical protein